MKKIIGIAVIVVATITASWNFSQNQNQNQNHVELSNLALANVEALAQQEGIYPMGICWKTLSFDYLMYPPSIIIYCLGCQYVKANFYSDSSVCSI